MVSKTQFEKIALSFEGVEKGESYGKPAFLLAKKFFTRLRQEDNSAVLIVGSIDERDMLIEVEPGIFHVTSHYKDYPAVLARLAKADSKTLQGLLAQHWRRSAPKSLLKKLSSPLDEEAPVRSTPGATDGATRLRAAKGRPDHSSSPKRGKKKRKKA
ncbi:MAG: MmcQ/YjbR family DNA-binding protein [Alphaproteobacteria bacterium]|nr:MmcQ/YjbR family DNA-binding protein [Alphaproteobacteria bacterium]